MSDDALSLAHIALAKIEDHEKLCAFRWTEICKKLAEMSDFQKKATYGTLSILLTTVGYLTVTYVL